MLGLRPPAGSELTALLTWQRLLMVDGAGPAAAGKHVASSASELKLAVRRAMQLLPCCAKAASSRATACAAASAHASSVPGAALLLMGDELLLSSPARLLSDAGAPAKCWSGSAEQV